MKRKRSTFNTARRRNGHTCSPGKSRVEPGNETDNPLYRAVRALEEKAAGLRRLAEHFPSRYCALVDRYERRANRLYQLAARVRQVLGWAAGPIV